MALHLYRGNLFESDCTVFLHQCNCQSTMGAGIAKTIRTLFPEAYDADCQFSLPPEKRLGHYSYAFTKDGKHIIVNLYGQFHWKHDPKTGKATVQEKFREALTRFLKKIEGKDTLKTPYDTVIPIKMGFPYKIGCDLAGGDWLEMERDLQELSELFHRDFHIYELK